MMASVSSVKNTPKWARLWSLTPVTDRRLVLGISKHTTAAKTRGHGKRWAIKNAKAFGWRFRRKEMSGSGNQHRARMPCPSSQPSTSSGFIDLHYWRLGSE